MSSELVVVLNLWFVVATRVVVGQNTADKLLITGLVDHALTFTIDTLRTMPAKTAGRWIV